MIGFCAHDFVKVSRRKEREERRRKKKEEKQDQSDAKEAKPKKDDGTLFHSFICADTKL